MSNLGDTRQDDQHCVHVHHRITRGALVVTEKRMELNAKKFRGINGYVPLSFLQLHILLRVNIAPRHHPNPNFVSPSLLEVIWYRWHYSGILFINPRRETNRRKSSQSISKDWLLVDPKFKLLIRLRLVRAQI
jgi:hypothetical protein